MKMICVALFVLFVLAGCASTEIKKADVTTGGMSGEESAAVEQTLPEEKTGDKPSVKKEAAETRDGTALSLDDTKAGDAKVSSETIALLTEESVFFGNGELDQYTVMKYNPADFLLLKKEKYGADGTLCERVEYNYRDEMLYQKRNLGRDDSVFSYHVYTYNKRKLLEEDEFYNGKGVVQSISKYAYDDNSVKTGWRVYGASGKLLATTNYIYREKKLVRKEIFSTSGSLEKYSTIAYDENGRIMQESFYYPNGDLDRAVSYLYADNRLSSETFLDASGDIIESVLYEYNDYADVKKIVLLNKRGDVKEITEKKYKYQPVTRLIQD